MPSNRGLIEWKSRRSKTFTAFILQATALGMEYSLTFITLWPYLETTIQTGHVKLYYTLISAAYLMSQVVSSIALGRLADKHRNIKGMFLLGNTLVVTGNMLYTIPFSPWFLFAGRLLSGGGGCLRCVMTGELARSYPHEEITKKLSLMGMAFALGFIIGPGINFGFLHADFWFGNIHIEYTNAPGFYLTIVFILMLFFSFAMVSNLSKEYDLKQNVMELQIFEEEEKGDESEVEEFVKDEAIPLIVGDYSKRVSARIDNEDKALIIKMIRNCDSFLILGLSFFFMYNMVTFDLWQPLAVLKLNQWGVREINAIIFGYGIVTVFALLTFSFFPLNDKVIVYFSMLCTFAISGINMIFLLFDQLPYNKVLNIILWILFDIFFSILAFMEEIFLIGVMAKMTSSAYQSFAESIRLSFSRTGALVALITAAATFSHLTVICSVLAVLGFVAILLICARRRTLQTPTVQIK